MKQTFITVLLLLGVTLSFSQSPTAILQETNVNHNGMSLGINTYQEGLLYSKKEGRTKKVDSYSLFYAKKIDSVTFDIENEEKLENLNISFNNGAPAVYQEELFYTANSGRDVDYNKNNYVDYTVSKEGENTLQIFISKRNEKGEWEFPTYVTFSNIEHNFTTPFITQDGNKLYFASDRPGGFGGYDIYVSERQEDNTWGEPKNLGETINSPQNDVYPSLYENNLYFSSKQAEDSTTDIYYSTHHNGTWNTKTALTSLNSPYDDFSIRFVTTTTGYLSSNRNNKEIDETFYFRLQEPQEEKLISAVKENKEEQITTSITKVDTLITEKTTVDVTNTKLVSSKAIYFDLNEYRIQSEGRFELDRIAYNMNNNPQFVVEILGYTDASGANEMNLSLSQKRAKAVEEYLAHKGIAKVKIVDVKGYGEKNLINDCVDYSLCGEEANAKNRRVEVKILEVVENL